MIKLVSAMKLTKDMMDEPLSTLEINKYLDLYKSIGATHVDIAQVIGHPEYKDSTTMWMNAVHAKGMSVTLRSAHQNMEFERNPDGSLKYRADGKPAGLYGAEAFVGSNRKPANFWIDEAVNALKDLPWKAGDEEAIYPERTEGIFSDDTAFLFEGLPGSYADFFIQLHNAIKDVVPSGVVVGMSANNASELLSGWMPRSLSDKFGVVVVDHYVDGDPVKYEADIRKINQMYGKPVYVQESAPHRFEVPTHAEADAHYAVNKKLADEGILYGYGAWGGWVGNPESVITDTGLTPAGIELRYWWEEGDDDNLPPDEDEPDEDDEEEVTIADVYLEVLRLGEEIDAQVKLEMIEDIAWGSGTLSSRMKKIKIIVPN